LAGRDVRHFRPAPLADVHISINDNGATPAIVVLRLDRAVAEFSTLHASGRR
jgi:hypothetical protein